MGKYGLPLDNRSTYTKLDWCVWTACLTDSRAEFDSHIKPLWKWANETGSRVPLSDWFHTHDGKQAGFQARSVVGGVFMPMLVKMPTGRRWSDGGGTVVPTLPIWVQFSLARGWRNW